MTVSLVGNIFDQIETYGIDAIQNAANCIGKPMGRGIAGEIRLWGGYEIQDDAYRVCSRDNPCPGDAYSTISGSLKARGIKRIIHACTMKQPNGYTDYDIVRSAFKAAIKLAEQEGVTCLGCTALGTGVGRLDPKLVAAEMVSALIGADSKISFVFCDHNADFINEIKKLSKLV